MKKRKPKYIKILEGMNCCYGGSDERKCSDCPYDKYNDRDFFGQGTSYCMEKLNKDAMEWAQGMSVFTNCCDCCMYKDGNTDRYDHDPQKKGKTGWCAQWEMEMLPTEFCSRGAFND